MNLPVYLDHHATTPMDARVLDAMMPWLTGKFGNASSTDHSYGSDAAAAVEAARERVASLIGASPGEIVFTGGATESDAIALIGIMERYAGRGDHLVTCTTEHKAVLETAKRLEMAGKRVTYVPVDRYGEVDYGGLEAAMSDDTVLVSVMSANNEVGTIPDIARIGKLARDRGALFHTDAAQAAGHVPLDVWKMSVDLMSLSAHKMYGPKGVGALYVRGTRPRVMLEPVWSGGGQEGGLRAGTHNVPGIVGFGKAAVLAKSGMCAEAGRLTALSDRVVKVLAETGAKLNGHPTRRLPHNINMRFPNVDGKAIINSVSDRLAISAGSACTTSTVEPSHVLTAMGLDEEEAHSSIRIGLGRSTTRQEADFAAETLVEYVKRLAAIAG